MDIYVFTLKKKDVEIEWSVFFLPSVHPAGPLCDLCLRQSKHHSAQPIIPNPCELLCNLGTHRHLESVVLQRKRRRPPRSSRPRNWPRLLIRSCLVSLLGPCTPCPIRQAYTLCSSSKRPRLTRDLHRDRNFWVLYPSPPWKCASSPKYAGPGEAMAATLRVARHVSEYT